MGGRPPLGYDGVDRRLAINPAEAEIVQHIFARYLELGSVIDLQADLAAREIRSKRWTNKRGVAAGGAPFSRGALYYLLVNPVYRGAIRHRDKVYRNAHPAIVDEPLWLAVQAELAANCPDHPDSPRLAAEVLLRGLLFDDRGEAMTTVHTTRGAKRYRYYARDTRTRAGGAKAVGSVPRIAMGVLDEFVVARVTPLLARGWRPDAPSERRVREALVRVSLGEDRVVMTIRAEAASARPHADDGCIRKTEEGLELAASVRLKHRQGAILIVGPVDAGAPGRVDRTLVRAISLARAWAAALAAGEIASTRAMALRFGFCNRYAGQLLPLTWLAPDLVEEILAGRQPRAVTLAALIRTPLPMEWAEQQRMLATVG